MRLVFDKVFQDLTHFDDRFNRIPTPKDPSVQFEGPSKRSWGPVTYSTSVKGRSEVHILGKSGADSISTP